MRNPFLANLSDQDIMNNIDRNRADGRVQGEWHKSLCAELGARYADALKEARELAAKKN